MCRAGGLMWQKLVFVAGAQWMGTFNGGQRPGLRQVTHVSKHGLGAQRRAREGGSRNRRPDAGYGYGRPEIRRRTRRPRQSAGEATGVNHRQRTKTSRLVRRHFNAHICSSANMTRILKVKIPNSNINFEVRKFEVRLTSLMITFSYCPMHYQQHCEM